MSGEEPASPPEIASAAKAERVEKLNGSADDAAPAADAPRLSQLDDPKDQLSTILRLSTGQFSSAACYMAMMFFALSTAINCVVLDESPDDRAHSSPLLRATRSSPQPAPRPPPAQLLTKGLCCAAVEQCIPHDESQRKYATVITVQRAVTFLFGSMLGNLSCVKSGAASMRLQP